MSDTAHLVAFSDSVVSGNSCFPTGRKLRSPSMHKVARWLASLWLVPAGIVGEWGCSAKVKFAFSQI